MSRLSLTFECQGKALAGTLDTAPGSTGLLIVSGGNEVRSGAFGGQAELAAKIAKAGFPVFRYDRRGIGDSDGENRGFRMAKKDLAAAIEAFRGIAPQINRVIAFGNCDAASALMLAKGRDCDGLILSNPWIFDAQDDTAMAPDAVRSRYSEKLRNPKELIRLLTGKVSFRKLASGLRNAARPAAPQSSLLSEMRAGLDGFDGPVRFLIAGRDRTGQAFDAQWQDNAPNMYRCDGASHAYVEPESRIWLEAQILEALRQ